MDKKEIQKLIKDFSTYRIEVQTLEELTNYENKKNQLKVTKLRKLKMKNKSINL
jgi:adenylyl- and sulfurtransferase ThiI